MNQDEIIEMARQAGFHEHDFPFKKFKFEAFAKLVAAKEREACAKIAETPVGEYEVVVACGTEPAPYRIPRYLDSHSIAEAIRARS